MIVAVFIAALSAQGAYSAWGDCLSARGSEFARGGETTEVAAIATLGACKAEEAAYFAGAYRTPTIERMLVGPRNIDRRFVADQQANRERTLEDTRQQLVAQIAALRATLSLAR